MRLSEMRTEVTPQKINKVMESRFGFSIDYDNLTYAKAERLRNAISENIVAIKKSFGAHTAEKNSKYMELMLVKEGLDKWLGSEQGLFESEMGRSEAVLAAKDIVDSVQDMLEKISKIQNEQVPALIDTIRDQIGSEQAEQFKGSISPMLVELYSALSTAREGSDTAVRQLAGEDVGQSMDMNMGGGDADLGGASDFDDEDMFGAEPAAAGGAVGDLDQPELGRERRDMSESQRRKMDEMFAFDTKGKDRGPRDTGSDELARRAKLGKNPITRHAPDYKTKDKYGDGYKIGGPKGKLPEGDMEEGSVDEAAVRIMAKPEGSQVTRGTAAYVPKNSIAGKTPQGQAHRDATAAMAKAARAAGGKLAIDKTTDTTGTTGPSTRDALAKGVTPYRSSTEEGNDFTGSRLASIKAGKPTFSVGGKTYRVTGDTSDETRTRK